MPEKTLDDVVNESQRRKEKARIMLMTTMIIIGIFSLNLVLRPNLTGFVVHETNYTDTGQGSEIINPFLEVYTNTGKTASLNEEITIYAIYKNSENSLIPNADCTINIAGQTQYMYYDVENGYYYTNRFSEDGFKDYSISCRVDGENFQQHQDFIIITQDCVIPKDNLIIRENTKICEGTYYVDDIFSDGLITVKNPKASLDCTGVTLIGKNRGIGIIVPSPEYKINGDCSIQGFKTPYDLEKGAANLITANAVYSNEVNVMISEAYIGDNIVSVPGNKIGISSLQFRSINYLSNLRFIFQKTESANLPKLQNAYEYVSITSYGLTDSDAEKIEINYKVKKDWFMANNLDKSKTRIYTLNNNDWQEHTTTQYFEDAENYYYKAQVMAFNNIIAVAAEKNTATTKPITEQPQLILIDETEQVQNTNQQSTITTKDDELLRFAQNNLLLIIGPFAIILILLAVFYELRLINKNSITNTEELTAFIQTSLTEGVSEQEIAQELETNGWSKEMILQELQNAHLLPKKEEDIEAYISKKTYQKIPKEKIRQELQKAGWQKEIIDTYLK